MEARVDVDDLAGGRQAEVRQQPQGATGDAVPPPEYITVIIRRVACDGGGVLGHPMVYLDMGGADVVECGYCDRRFVLPADYRAERISSPGGAAAEAH